MRRLQRETTLKAPRLLFGGHAGCVPGEPGERVCSAVRNEAVSGSALRRHGKLGGERVLRVHEGAEYLERIARRGKSNAEWEKGEEGRSPRDKLRSEEPRGAPLPVCAPPTGHWLRPFSGTCRFLPFPFCIVLCRVLRRLLTLPASRAKQSHAPRRATLSMAASSRTCSSTPNHQLHPCTTSHPSRSQQLLHF